MKFEEIVFLLIAIAYFSCNSDQKEDTLRVIGVDSFEEEKKIVPTIVEGLEIQLWAPGPLLSNAVALTIDNKGVAYVAETSRRKSSDIDIREHPDWQDEDLGLLRIEDTRDFHLSKLATSLSDENGWITDFNKDSIHDYRDLAVQSEYIRKVWDSDGDGRADRSEIYADGFNDMLTGIAAGILSHKDDIYLTTAPDLWKLRDKDSDGLADERESLSYGYGIHIAYAGHDMSGLTMGPDGKLYWSIGDMGVNTLDQEGNRYAYPHEGAVMRANPDGSDLEVFAHGLRNPQDISFDAYGNLITVDNDGDHPGEHERYVHIIEGSDSGWRIHWQYGKYDLPHEEYKIWMDEGLYLPHYEGQAAFLLPPLALAYNGPAGLAYNPGTALSADWEGYFFASFFTGSSKSSKIQAFRLSPKGASFDVEEPKDILGGIVPTGIIFGPDGALYLNDWKDSYNKKPEGRIWKIDASPNAKHPLANQTQEILFNGAKNTTDIELENQLSHPDQRVRLQAQFELVDRNEKGLLRRIALEGTTQLQRIHAIWGLGQIGRRKPATLHDLIPLLSDEDPEIRAQVAKVVGDARFTDAAVELHPLLKDPNPRVQLLAIEAIGKIGNSTVSAMLIQLLKTIEESDPHLRHSVMYALSRITKAADIATLSVHSSKYVRLGAVVALRHQKSPKVSQFLTDTDELVAIEAARAINDDTSIPASIPSLAESLTESRFTSEAYIRRAINANLRQATKENAIRLVSYSKNIDAPIKMRKDALWALGYWKAPLVLDRVDGRHRVLSGHKLSDAHEALAGLLPSLLTSEEDEVRSSIIEAMGRLDYTEAASQVQGIYFDNQESIKVKAAAIKALGDMNAPELVAIIHDGLYHENDQIRDLVQGYISVLDITDYDKTDLYNKIITNNPVSEKQKAIVNLGLLKSARSIDILKGLMQDLLDGNVSPTIQLDIYNAAAKSSSQELKILVENYESMLASKAMSDQYTFALEGGDASKGKEIFINNNSAQCLRCHAAGGYGGIIGPDLTKIASKLNSKQLLESLIDPNIRIAPGYGSVYVTKKDGSEVSGILQKEDNSQITLLIGDEAKIISRNEIKEVEKLPSGMLDMRTLLGKNQIRDLMAFLVTLR